MARSRTTAFVCVLFLAPVTALLVSACSGTGGERTLIRSYFLAARLNDRPTLNNIAMVAFPRDEGTVSTFSVDSVEEEQSRPLRFKELNTALMTAEEAEEEFATEMVAYQEEHFEAITRVLAAERDEEDVARRDTEVQEAWTDWRQRSIEHAKTVSAAQVELDGEENEASLSVSNSSDPVILTEFDGELLTKEVSITANFEEVDGTESERPMVITLQKAVLTGSDGTMVEGYWVVSQVN